jgi:chromatin modification-related protein VID21
MLGSKSSSHSLNGDAEENKSNGKAKISQYAPMREKIVYGTLDKLFLGPEDLDFLSPAERAERADQDLLHVLGLNTLFPELQPFGMLDVAPPTVVDPTKKKSSRSVDKDDPNKRIEEINYTRVMPAGTFMMSKPTLLGPLQPSKRWKDGKWLPMEEYSVPADLDSTNRITEEALCGWFSFLNL